MRTAVFVNPFSGRRRGVEIGRHAARELSQANHDVELIIGSDLSAAQARLRATLNQGLDSVVVVGGDGALNHILADVIGAKVVVGLLPSGTGNDTARALGIPRRDPQAALEIVLRQHWRWIDVAQVNGEHFVMTVVASGFDSKVNERADRMRWPTGDIRYKVAAIAELGQFRPLNFTVTLDDDAVLAKAAMLVAVGNGPSFGGGLRICEGAELDDGLVDVAIINPVSKAKLVRFLPKLYSGSHTTLPEFEIHRVRSVQVDCDDVLAYGDGERLAALPIRVEAVPAALRFFTG